MRSKKAFLNSIINIIAYLAVFIPNLIIRKVFLQSLGNELLGLNSLYSNIIGWLSIIELGVGSAIIYSLYKPYAENNKVIIRAYIRFYGKFYRKIGLLVLTLGIVILPFLQFFISDKINIGIAQIGFLLFLLNSFISYMFSHKLCILNVAQEAYKITIGTTISKILIILIQYIILKIHPNFILFIIIQLIINLIYFIIINFYINRKYSWLNKQKDELDFETKKGLLKNVRALFMHKIGGLVVNSTDNIIISKFIGLAVLANYANYQVIITAFQTIVNTGLNGITASIGNLLVESDDEKSYDIHKKVFFINFWIVSFLSISLYNTLNQFIAIWVGQEYILDNLTFIIIIINLYFFSMRGSVEQFQNGSGNFYQDRYAPICEAIINIVMSIILVNKIGLAGVFLGTLISNFTVIFWTKPYVVYKYVFNRRLREYFIMYFKYLVILVIPLAITNIITNEIKHKYTLTAFIINCTINIIVINVTYLIIFFRTNEFKYYYKMIINFIKK